MNVEELAIIGSYANSVWDAWCEARPGKEWPPIMPLDFWTIRGWHERGIPVRIVLRAFKDLRLVPTDNIRYAIPIVNETFDHWRRNMTL